MEQSKAVTKDLTMPSILIPLVRALRDDDVPTRRIGQVIFEPAAAAYRLIPAPIRWLDGVELVRREAEDQMARNRLKAVIEQNSQSIGQH